MARATKEEAQKTRQRILDTAIALFNRDGVSVTTLEHMAEAAGLTRGAIYWHFKNKNDVVTAIHDQLHLSILETMYRELDDLSRPPVKRIKTASKQFLLQLASDELQQKVVTIFTLKCDYSGDMAGFLEQQAHSKQEGSHLFAARFQDAIDSGDIDKRWSADFLARAHLFYLVGIITEYIKDKKLPALKNDADQLIDFYFYKLVKDPA